MSARGSGIPTSWVAYEAARIWANENPDRTFPSPLTVKIGADPIVQTVQSRSIGRSPGYTLTLPASVRLATSLDAARERIRPFVLQAMAAVSAA